MQRSCVILVTLLLVCSSVSLVQGAAFSADLSDTGAWSVVAQGFADASDASATLGRKLTGSSLSQDQTLEWDGGLGSGAAAYQWFTGAHFAILPSEASELTFSYSYNVKKVRTWEALSELYVDAGLVVENGNCHCWYQDSGAAFTDELWQPSTGNPATLRTNAVALDTLASQASQRYISGPSSCEQMCPPNFGDLNSADGNPLRAYFGLRTAAWYTEGAQGQATLPYQLSLLTFEVQYGSGFISSDRTEGIQGAYAFNLPLIWEDSTGLGNTPFAQETALTRCPERTEGSLNTPGLTCDSVARAIEESGNITSGNFAAAPRYEFRLPINMSPRSVSAATMVADVYLDADCAPDDVVGTGAIARSAGDNDRGFGVRPGANGVGCQLWAWSGRNPVFGPQVAVGEWYRVEFLSTRTHVTLVVNNQIYSASVSSEGAARQNADVQETATVVVGSEAFAFAGGVVDNLYVTNKESSLNALQCVQAAGLDACANLPGQEPFFGSDSGRFHRSHLVPRATRIMDTNNDDRIYAFLGNTVDGAFVLFDLGGNSIADGFYVFADKWQRGWVIMDEGYPIDAPQAILHESQERRLAKVIYGQNSFADATESYVAGSSVWQILKNYAQDNTLRGESLYKSLQFVADADGSRAALGLVGSAAQSLLRDGSAGGDQQFSTALPPTNTESRLVELFEDAAVPLDVTNQPDFAEFGEVEVPAVDSVDNPVGDTVFSPMRVELTENFLARPSFLNDFQNRYLYGFSYQADASLRATTADSVYVEFNRAQPKVIDPYVSGWGDAVNRTLRLGNWPGQSYAVKYASDLGFVARWTRMQVDGWTLDPDTASGQASVECDVGRSLWVRDQELGEEATFWWTLYHAWFTPGMSRPEVAARVSAIRDVYNYGGTVSATAARSCADWWNGLVSDYSQTNATLDFAAALDGDTPAELGAAWFIEELQTSSEIATPKLIRREREELEASMARRAPRRARQDDEPDADELGLWTGSRFAFLLKFANNVQTNVEFRPDSGDDSTVAFVGYPIFTDLKVFNGTNARFHASKFIIALAKRATSLTFSDAGFENFANLLASGNQAALRTPVIEVEDIESVADDLFNLYDDFEAMRDVVELLNGLLTTSDPELASIRDNTADVYILGETESRNAHAIVLGAQTSPFDYPLQGIDTASYNFPKVIMSRERPIFFLPRANKLDMWLGAMYNSGDDDPRPVNYLPARNDNPSIEFRLENAGAQTTVAYGVLIAVLAVLAAFV